VVFSYPPTPPPVPPTAFTGSGPELVPLFVGALLLLVMGLALFAWSRSTAK